MAPPTSNMAAGGMPMSLPEIGMPYSGGTAVSTMPTVVPSPQLGDHDMDIHFDMISGLDALGSGETLPLPVPLTN